MDYRVVLGGMAIVAAFIQYFIYIKDVLKGKTRPHAFSWFVWGVPCGIVFAAQLVRGGGAGSWATAATTLLCTFIFVLSLFYGEKTITRIDWIGFLLALAATGLWAITDDPLGAVALITFADLMGFVPTVRKSLQKPHEEPISSYLTGVVKWILSLGALGSYTPTTFLYPLAMVVANSSAAILLAQRRKFLAKKIVP